MRRRALACPAPAAEPAPLAEPAVATPAGYVEGTVAAVALLEEAGVPAAELGLGR